MDRILGDLAQIPEQYVCGFHQYALTPAIRLAYVSDSLLSLLGIGRADLGQGPDPYLSFVHPADQASYDAFLAELSQGPQERTADYRLVRRDGTVLHIRDRSTTSRLADGTLVSSSCLTDITDLKTENQELSALNQTVPCGILKYTYAPQPQVTYINRQMRRIMGLPEEGQIPEVYQGSLYLMIPPEQRPSFARYIDRVYHADAPIAGELTVLRADGSKAQLFGWATKCLDAQGREEIQSVCMDVTDRTRRKKEAQARRYLDALTEVYDLIIGCDAAAGTLTFLSGKCLPGFRQLEGLAMRWDQALEKWLSEAVAPEDRPRLRAFFQALAHPPAPSQAPPRIDFQGLADGRTACYTGIYLRLDEPVGWFCCRQLTAQAEAEQLRTENTALKEDLQQLVMCFTDGLAAFMVRGNMVTPLYASDNVCEFFGISKDQWLTMMRTGTPIRDFVARSEGSYGDFAELLQTGEREFTYFDLHTETERRIRAICSPKEPVDGAARYIMLYKVDEQDPPVQAPSPDPVIIRTFGYFDVFVGEKPIAFRNKKSKELLALLVDRRGGYVTSEEAISVLWEDEPASPVTLARYRKVALRLKNILEEYGITHIVESVDGKRRLVPGSVRCDLYEYLSGKDPQLFKGNYLSNYSWGETTLAELTGQLLG